MEGFQGYSFAAKDPTLLLHFTLSLPWSVCHLFYSCYESQNTLSLFLESSQITYRDGGDNDLSGLFQALLIKKIQNNSE